MISRILYIHRASHYWASAITKKVGYEVQSYNNISEMPENLQFSKFDIAILDFSSNCIELIERLKKEKQDIIILGLGEETDFIINKSKSELFDRKIIAERDDLIDKIKEIHVK